MSVNSTVLSNSIEALMSQGQPPLIPHSPLDYPRMVLASATRILPQSHASSLYQFLYILVFCQIRRDILVLEEFIAVPNKYIYAYIYLIYLPEIFMATVSTACGGN